MTGWFGKRKKENARGRSEWVQVKVQGAREEDDGKAEEEIEAGEAEGNNDSTFEHLKEGNEHDCLGRSNASQIPYRLNDCCGTYTALRF